MALVKVHGIKVGSIVKVKGVDYKVARNLINNLVLNKKVGIAYEQGEVVLQNILPGANLDTYIEVVSEPKADLTSQLRGQLASPSSGLTEQLRKQKAQQDLTDSLRSQVEDEEDGDGEECTCSDCCGTCGENGPDDGDEDNFGFITASSISVGHFPGVEEAKNIATTANLRSQAAQQDAKQARFDATIAKASAKGAYAATESVAEQVSERLEEFADAHNALADAFEREVFNQTITNDSLTSIVRDVSSQVHEVEHYAQSVSDVAHNALRKVEAIESKQKQEELKVNLQQQLNASLSQKSLTSKLQNQLNQNSTKTTGGNGVMKNVFGAFKNQFGKVEGKFAYSFVTGGLALRKGISQDFVAYDAKTGALTDVSGLTLDFNVPAFKLPVGEKDVKPGDLVIHNGEFVYVTKKADGYLEVINPEKAVRGSVIPTKNALLGAAFYTVVKTLDAAGEGGFNPLLLMALNKGGDSSDLLPLLLMSGGLGGNGAAAGGIDPMLFALLGDDVEDLLPLVLMQQGGATGAGFNPLFFLLSQKGGKGKDLLPLLAMTGGLGGATQGQAGAINPMMLMALAGDGGSDMKDIFLMQALTGQNIFGGAQAPAKTDAPKETGK